MKRLILIIAMFFCLTSVASAMDKNLLEALYCDLEGARISMGASLTTMLPGKGWALQDDAFKVLPRLKAMIKDLNDGKDVDLNEVIYLMLETERIVMGASLASRDESNPLAPGWKLQDFAIALLPRLKNMIKMYDSR